MFAFLYVNKLFAICLKYCTYIRFETYFSNPKDIILYLYNKCVYILSRSKKITEKKQIFLKKLLYNTKNINNNNIKINL